MKKTFYCDGTEYTVETVTAIAGCDDGCEEKRQPALLVGNWSDEESKTEWMEFVVFGWDMPDGDEEFKSMIEDDGAWDSDWEVLATVRRPIDIKARIKQLGMTQAELSSRSGVNARQITRIISGESDIGNMTSKNLLALAKALEVSVEALLEGTSESDPESYDVLIELIPDDWVNVYGNAHVDAVFGLLKRAYAEGRMRK